MTERSAGTVGLTAGLERNVLHAQNPVLADYSICGLAFDAYESGDVDRVVRFAAAGETVTCLDCRRAVIEARKIRLGRLRSNDAAHSRTAGASSAAPSSAAKPDATED